MADERQLAEGVVVKRRNPWGAWALGLVTLGIYYLVWYYKINKELRDYPRASIQVEPVVALIAITIGSLIIVPPYVSIYNTGKRVLEAQEAASARERINPWIALGLSLVAGLHVPYVQTQLNKVWDVEFEQRADSPMP